MRGRTLAAHRPRIIFDISSPSTAPPPAAAAAGAGTAAATASDRSKPLQFNMNCYVASKQAQ